MSTKNTAVYYVFLYMYACITNDFCSDKIKSDETFQEEVLKIWDAVWGDTTGGTITGTINGVGIDTGTDTTGGTGDAPIPPRYLFEVSCKELHKNPALLEEMKVSFLKVRSYWGALPEDYFEEGIEDKVARMVITLAIFNGTAKSIPGYRHLLNNKECTNLKNQIHMDCLVGFGEDIGVGGFKVDYGRVSTSPGIHVTLINGHFIPYFVNATSIFFVDMEYTIPEEILGSGVLKPFEKIFLNYKIRQLGEECGLHSIMSVLYTKIVEINPYFIWYRDVVPVIDYKSLTKMKYWLKENHIDSTALLRVQEFVSYKIF